MSDITSEVCQICGGLGIVGRDVPVGHPDFGKAFPCVCQTEIIKTRKASQLRRLGNLDAYADKTFTAFQVDHNLLADESAYLRDICAAMNLSRQRGLNDEQRYQVNLAALLA